MNRLSSRSTGVALALALTLASGTTFAGASSPASPVVLTPVSHVLAFPPGQAGLRTTRLEVLLASRPLAHGGKLVYRDRNYSGRIGWKEIVVQAGSGARISASSAPSSSISQKR